MEESNPKLPIPDPDLSVADPELMELVNLERKRQIESLELIASENF